LFSSFPKPKRVRGTRKEPIRAETFSVARLELHAESLARAQEVATNAKLSLELGPQISENIQILEQTYAAVILAVESHRAITPAAEWLIDNFHVVRALLKEISDYLDYVGTAKPDPLSLNSLK